MSASLWQSTHPEQWQTIRQQYNSIIDEHASEKLKELNRWYEVELPQTITSRAPNGHITQGELVKLVDWKLTHGKWRPRLLDYAKTAPEQQVHEASSKAFALLGNNTSITSDGQQEPASKKPRTSKTACAPPAAAQSDVPTADALDMPTVKAALESLTALKGVGPATASALLAAVNDSCPFMGDEALEAALEKRDYTVKMYLQLVTAMREKANWLNEQGATGDAPWSAVIVERCLHAAQFQQQAPAAPADAAGADAKPKPGSKQKSTLH